MQSVELKNPDSDSDYLNTTFEAVVPILQGFRLHEITEDDPSTSRRTSDEEVAKRTYAAPHSRQGR